MNIEELIHDLIVFIKNGYTDVEVSYDLEIAICHYKEKKQRLSENDTDYLTARGWYKSRDDDTWYYRG